MAFDGIVTRAIVSEIKKRIVLGKIDRIHQPTKGDLVLTIYTKEGNIRLYASVKSSDCRLHLIRNNPDNPPRPYPFCMLLRKQLTGARVTDISQKGSDRIIELWLETRDDLGFTRNKKLIFEIMGKHSNIILVDLAHGTIIDSIKHVSPDTSRVRQVLPGQRYEAPPAQTKIPYDTISPDAFASISRDGRSYLAAIGGISPAFAADLADRENPWAFLKESVQKAEAGTFVPRIYYDETGRAVDFHLVDLRAYEQNFRRIDFPDLSSCIDAFYDGKAEGALVREKAGKAIRQVKSLLDKAYLKKQRLQEDILKAQEAPAFQLYGELLTAHLHQIDPKATAVTVLNYYTNENIEIGLDPRYTPAENAQRYYKKYSKAKTAVAEKNAMLAANAADIEYLESVLTYLDQADRPDLIDDILAELRENGYIRQKRNPNREKRKKRAPLAYTSPSGFLMLAGRNNRENDELTLKIAEKSDLWFHTKDIPGSHIILKSGKEAVTPADIYAAASLAAYYSKARQSANVPVDYVRIRYVKKPSGAKPGKVIFTNNSTVYVDPKVPVAKDGD